MKYNNEILNEGWNSKLASMALYLALLFNSIDGDSRKVYDYEYFKRYTNSMSIANSDTLVMSVIKDFKQRVLNDPKILNKQEVLKVIDNTPFVWRNSDKICDMLFNAANKRHDDSKASSLCFTPYKGESFIFLNKQADYYEVMHELSHAIEPFVQLDPRIMQLFNFNKNYQFQNETLMFLTNGEYSLHKASKDIEYLSDSGEMYSRMNSLKMFLYKNKLLKTPFDDIDENMILDLISAKVYMSLDEKNKIDFKRSDFIHILIFIDVDKYYKVSKYVRMKRKEIKEKGITTIISNESKVNILRFNEINITK